MSKYHEDSKDAAEKRVERVRSACETAPEVRSIARKEATKAVRAHERHDHKGEKPTPIEAMCSGGAAKKRLDRAGYKKGGKVKPGTEVNVIVGEGNKPAPAPMAMPPGPPMPPPTAAAPPPRPPMLPPGAGGPPPGLAPAPGLPPRKRGGRSPKEEEFTGGAGSGIGRLEKIAAYGNKT